MFTKIKVKKFFPYQAVSIRDVFWSSSEDEYGNIVHSINKAVEDKKWEPVGFTFDNVNIKDNKVCFEIESREGKTFYVSFYDGLVSIGFRIVERDYNPDTHYFELN